MEIGLMGLGTKSFSKLPPISFDYAIQQVQSHNKFKIMDILGKHKFCSKFKLKMMIPLCRMISMLVVHLALTITFSKWNKPSMGGMRRLTKLFHLSSNGLEV
jgi:hypothetical protein